MKEYEISSESKAALERGDRQRVTGVYQTGIEHCDIALFKDWSDDSNGFHVCCLDAGHEGMHVCVGESYCHMTWE